MTMLSIPFKHRPNHDTRHPFPATPAGPLTVYNGAQHPVQHQQLTPYQCASCFSVFLCVLASGVVGRHSDLDQTDISGHDLDIVKERVYRSVGSDMRYLLDSMQSQLKFVTGNLDAVRRMCNVNNRPLKKGLFISVSI